MKAAPEEFGKRLLKARKQARMTQPELGRICHVSAQTICRWERGWNVPSIQDLANLSGALDVSADWLLGLRNDKRHEKLLGRLERLIAEERL